MPEAELWKFSRVFFPPPFNCRFFFTSSFFRLSLNFYSLIYTFFFFFFFYFRSYFFFQPAPPLKTRRRLALSPLIFVSRDTLSLVCSKWRRFISYFFSSSALACSACCSSITSLNFCSLRALQLVCCSLASSAIIHDTSNTAIVVILSHPESSQLDLPRAHPDVPFPQRLR